MQEDKIEAHEMRNSLAWVLPTHMVEYSYPTESFLFWEFFLSPFLDKFHGFKVTFLFSFLFLAKLGDLCVGRCIID